jgi:hypothetical protein
MIDLATRITVPESVLFRDLDGEAVLLETSTGRYYGLNEVGTRMWSLLQLHGEIEAAYQDLLAEYQVPSHELRRDLLDFVGLLTSRRLIEIDSPEGASR